MMDADGVKARVRVLLAEDSRTLRELIRLMLVKASIDADTVADGAAAIGRVEAAAVEGRPYDLVLMDVMMPEVNGVHATWVLRRRGYTGKIVLMTAADERYDLAASLSAGADDFLAKPFSPEDLRRVLEANACAAS